MAQTEQETERPDQTKGQRKTPCYIDDLNDAYTCMDKIRKLSSVLSGSIGKKARVELSDIEYIDTIGELSNKAISSLMHISDKAKAI